MSRSKKPRGFSIKFPEPRPKKERHRYSVTFAEKRRINGARFIIAVWAADDENVIELAEKLVVSAYGRSFARQFEYIYHEPEFDIRASWQ